MKYTVRVTASATKDADAAYIWLADRTIHAIRWPDGLEKAIEDLSDLPTRWPQMDFVRFCVERKPLSSPN